jgi:hypothetical protein
MGILLYKLVFGFFPFDGTTMHDIKESVLNAELKFP